jgi:hypothetical protein
VRDAGHEAAFEVSITTAASQAARAQARSDAARGYAFWTSTDMISSSTVAQCGAIMLERHLERGFRPAVRQSSQCKRNETHQSPFLRGDYGQVWPCAFSKNSAAPSMKPPINAMTWSVSSARQPFFTVFSDS